jgi:serine protease AprX
MILTRVSQITAVVALLSLWLPPLATAQQGARNGRTRNSHKLDRALRSDSHRGSSKQRVIIRTRPGSTRAIGQALEQHGDVVAVDDADLNTIAAEVHTDDLEALADSSAVLSVSIDALVRADAARKQQAHRNSQSGYRKSPTLVTAQQTLTRVNEENLRDTLGLTGSSPAGTGVVVAVIDSGIAPLNDFKRRIAAFIDCTYERCTSTAAFDDYGHGTHVAGLIAGANSGVAPGATLIGLKVLDEEGSGRTSDVIKALQWVRNNKQRYNIQVANLSLGHPIYEKAETDPLVIAVQETVRTGVKVVVAAGNFGINPETGQPGYAGITSPGNSPNAITIGALQTFNTVRRDDDRVAPYSSRGPTWYDGFLKPDIVAPGDALMSTMPFASALTKKLLERGSQVSKYARLSGTSMATAVASGVVATVLEANGRQTATVTQRRLGPLAVSPLSSGAVKALLQFTAVPVRDDAGELYDELTQGAGGINAGGAISLAARIDGSIAAPGYWLTGPSTGSFGSTTIGRQSYTWGQRILWDDNIVWGSGLMTHNQSTWNDNIVWGSDDNIVWGSMSGDDNIVWGSADDDNIVWGSVAEWADNIVWGSGLIGLNLGIDNIVWGSDDNIVWGSDDNIVWGSDDNIVWGSLNEDNIVWGSLNDDNIVWGSSDYDNIVWGSDDNIVWGSDVLLLGGTGR